MNGGESPPLKVLATRRVSSSRVAKTRVTLINQLTGAGP